MNDNAKLTGLSKSEKSAIKNQDKLRELCKESYEQGKRVMAEAYDNMLDGMGKNDISHFKRSDWEYVQSLKGENHD